MRNLKRALSLTLASVMLLGMMVVGSSAAGYDDVKETDNVEAIEVLQAIEVMVGDERGFGPERPVNRAEMAVVMGKLLNLDYNYYATSCPFNDVYDWARGYVGACYANKIVSGRGEGVYDPGATVTAVEAASMLMRALGYFQYANDVVDGFELSTVREGTKIGIFDEVGSSATDPMTRNQVAQMVLNALQSGMVEPDGNTINLTTPDGSVLTGKVNYVFRTSAKPFAQAISPIQATAVGSQNGGPIVELGEQLYDGKLTLVEDNVGGWNVNDEFNRPARHWEYDGKEIGTYAKYEIMRQEYTQKVTGKMLYELLGKEVIDNYDIDIAIDGETAYNVLNGHGYFSEASMIRTNTDAVGATGDGVLTQVFVDGVNKTVDIDIINTYLAKARQDYNTRDNDVDLTVYKINDDTVTDHYVKTVVANPQVDTKTEVMTVEGEDFEIEDVKSDDLFLVTVAEGEIQSMVKPEIISEATIGAFKLGSWVKSENAQYDYATTAMYDDEVLDMYSNTNMKDVTYNVILDKYGYLIGLELNEQPNQYLFLAGIDMGSSNISAQSAQANVIFLDGTMKTVTVNTADSETAATAKASDGSTTGYTITGGGKNFAGIKSDAEKGQINTWCTYTVNADGVYTLKQVGNFAGAANATPYVRGAKKVAQSYMNADDMVKTSGDSAEDDKIVINAKNVALEGSRKRNDATNGDFEYVYGTEKTVYINVDMKNVSTKSGGTRAIIDKVNSFATGVKNVDITATDLIKDARDPVLQTPPTNEVYILYSDKADIIGVVTLDAEDNGSTSSWAYITSGVNQEEYLGGSDWRWTKDAIIDGKAVKLTEKRDDYKYLKDSVTGTGGGWFEVSFDADGNVSKLKPNSPVNDPNGIWFATTDDKFITSVADVRLATNGITPYTKTNDTLLLYLDATCDAALSDHQGGDNVANLRFDRAKGTLYVETSTSEGFTVSNDVKVTVCLSNKHGSGAFNKVIDTYEGWDGLEDALKSLDCEKSAFDGYLSATFSNGRATSIILDDRSGSHIGVVENAPTMTVNVTKIGPNSIGLGSETIQWDGDAFDGTEVTTPTGYTWASATALTFVEKGTGNTTFTYTKDGGDVETKTGYVRVTFQTGAVGGTTGQLETKTVPVTVDLLGYGTLTASDVEKYVTPGYKLVTPFSASTTAIVPQSGGAAQEIKVQVAERTDVTGLALADATKKGDVKYGTILAGVGTELAASDIKFVVTYGTGTNKATRTIDADDANLVYTDDATAGTAVSTKNGTLVAKYNSIDAATATVGVEIYAEVSALTDFTGTNAIVAYDVSSSLSFAGGSAKVKVGDVFTITYTATADGVTTLGTNTTKAAAATGITPTSITTTETDGSKLVINEGTANSKATVVVTVKVLTLTANAVTVATDINT